MEQGNLVAGIVLLLVGIGVAVKAVKFVVKLAMLVVVAVGVYLFVQGL